MDFFLDELPHDGFNKGKKLTKENSPQAKKLDGDDAIEKIFTKINAHLTPEVSKETNACFVFVVKGNIIAAQYYDSFLINSK